MSFLENRRRGIPYGGIPYQELLNKLEETDMGETTDDIQENYNNYIRSEIIDRTLETPFLESDKTKRDSTLSKSVLNLRYNGSRGDYERPVHPEQFVGFMDHDNRGLDNNPRMNEYNQQISTRMPNLEIRMGHNCADMDYESPWTNQSLGQCRRDIQTSLAYNTKVFTDERDGRALNRNFVVDYDHNKKPLIYKDILPYTIAGTTEQNNGRINMSYVNSAVPFVSTDTRFTPSYKNNENMILIPGTKSCQKHISNDHELYDELMNVTRDSYILQQTSKLKNNVNDQVYSEHYHNYNTKVIPGTKYIANNTETDIQSNNLDANEFRQSKTSIVNPITNTKLLDNDTYLHESKHINNNRRNDHMKYSNATNYISNELHPHDISNVENDIQKSIGLSGNNNITLINSSFYIPEFVFKHLEIAKHAQFPDNQTIINKTNYDTVYGTQNESQIRANKYKFTDDVSNTMRYSTATVPDTTYLSQTRASSVPMQENKMSTVNNDNIWAISDENTMGKTQLQTFVGGIEPTHIDIPESHDIEITNRGKNIGNKSIRGDKVQNDYSTMSENLVYEDNF